ncbi:MAG: transposase [Burkholderiaceae bacterium]
MARLPRLIIPDQLHHVVQSGNDRQQIFQDAEDYEAFLKWLRESSKLFKVAIHAYTLMPDRVHLLLSPTDETGLARMMQWIGRYYVPYFNRKYQREGTLWKGRYKATVIDPEQYFMPCCRYIELNPVRSGLAAEPSEYRWSSYLHHIGARQDPVIMDHPKYWALGNTPFEREAAYRELTELALKEEEIRQISDFTAKGWALGSAVFKAGLEKKTQRRVSPTKRGRPAKQENSNAEAVGKTPS